MIYPKDSYEYRMNRAAFRETVSIVPMTSLERSSLARWILNGHDIDSNPWNYLEPDDESPMNFLKALRIRNGYSHGPWDAWEYASYIKPFPDTNDPQPDIW